MLPLLGLEALGADEERGTPKPSGCSPSARRRGPTETSSAPTACAMSSRSWAGRYATGPRAHGSRAGRDRPGGEIIYGRRPIAEAKRGRRRVRRVWTADDMSDAELTELAGSRIIRASSPRSTRSPTRIRRSARWAGGARRCARPGPGPHNLGAVVARPRPRGQRRRDPERRAAAVTAAVCKASAGAVEHLPVGGCATSRTGWVAQGDRRPLGLRAEVGAASPYTRADLTGPLVLVLGSEGKGIRPAGRRRLRRAGLDPGAGRTASPQRLGGGSGVPVRGRAPAWAHLSAAARRPRRTEARNCNATCIETRGLTELCPRAYTALA